MPNDDQNPEEKKAQLFDDLQKMITEELGEMADPNFKKAFRPLTGGLGLEPPKKEDVFFENAGEQEQDIPEEGINPLPEMVKMAKAATPEKKTKPAKVKPPDKKFNLSDALSQAKAANHQMKPREIPADSSPKEIPPVMPRPSVFRRILAAIIDEIFVVTLWLVAMVITLRLLTGSFVGLAATNITVVGDPQFIRFAILEFVALWFAYFAVCIGLLDMTFGMWIWGIKVGYGGDVDAATLGKKLKRTLLSFIFYAPVVPLAALVVVGHQGKNLLDILSGTTVYKTVG